jgi:hypothetical protein
MNSAPNSMGKSNPDSKWVKTRPPMRSRASTTWTDRPARHNWHAAANPATPAPITITAGSELIRLCGENGARSGAIARYAAFFLGTLAPFFRASERPMAMACLRLFTLPPLPPRPERKVPRFRRRIALSTVLLAPLLYLRRDDLFRPDDFFFRGIRCSLKLREKTPV